MADIKLMLPAKIKKRDGSLVNFDSKKILYAIEKAALEVLGDKDKAFAIALKVTDLVLKKISTTFNGRICGVESVQDIVEWALIEEGYSRIVKAYILYREERSDIRVARSVLGLKDDLKLPLNALEVLRHRYLLKDANRNIIETPSELFRRVAHHISQAEKNFKSPYTQEAVEERFYQIMHRLEFMPNSPTLMNAGTQLGQLSACFVIPVEDSMEGIFKALTSMAKIHQTGGGTGFSFSSLRPKGDLVSTTKGEASGPISFMEIFDKATSVIVQGGRRRGANMGILRCDHPDIVEFVEIKTKKDKLANFNLSVAVTDAFMEAVIKNKNFALINPRTKEKTKNIKARFLFDLIVSSAWRSGDPGLVFLDEINRHNPTPLVGTIEATNPCGELPLLPFESCNLASINLAKMFNGHYFDWNKLKECVHLGIRFLDDVVEVNKFPLLKIKEITFANRKVGLGLMGFADMLIRLKIPYNAKKAVRFAEQLMRFIRRESLFASAQLAKERGVFPNFKKSIYAKGNIRLRNATINTIAPTGTISIIAGCSSGIEPLFAISFVRTVLSGTRLFEVNPLFEEALRRRRIYSKEMMAQIAKEGTLRNIKGIPSEIKNIFVTAFDLNPTEHLFIQSVFQKYTDNSVSKTINLPQETSLGDVRAIYLLAYKLKCKGITIYRYGSKEEQVLSFAEDQGSQLKKETLGLLRVGSEYAGGCAVGSCPF